MMKRISKDQNQPPCLPEFVLSYGGVPNDEMLQRIVSGSRQLGGYAEELVACFEHEPGRRVGRAAAVRLSQWFTEGPTTAEIYAAARARGFAEMGISLALRLAEFYQDQPGEERICLGHAPSPVPVLGCGPLVLVAGCDSGRYLYGNSAEPDLVWSIDDCWAFEVPQA